MSHDLVSFKNGRLKSMRTITQEIEEMKQRYRPREIMQYEEGGKMIRVFEPRWCV